MQSVCATETLPRKHGTALHGYLSLVPQRSEDLATALGNSLVASFLGEEKDSCLLLVHRGFVLLHSEAELNSTPLMGLDRVSIL